MVKCKYLVCQKPLIYNRWFSSTQNSKRHIVVHPDHLSQRSGILLFRFVIILLLVSLLLGSLSWAKTINGDNSKLVFKVDYSTIRTNITGNNSVFVYSTRIGTQPQVIVGDIATLDLMPTNKPPTITDSGNLFNFDELTTEIVWLLCRLC